MNLRKTEYLYQMKEGTAYVSINSVVMSNDNRTLWLNVSTRNFSFKQSAFYPIQIKRKSVGLNDDFTLISVPESMYSSLTKSYEYTQRRINGFIELDNEGFFLDIIYRNFGERSDEEYARTTLFRKIQILFQIMKAKIESEKETENIIESNFSIDFQILLKKITSNDLDNLKFFIDFINNGLKEGTLKQSSIHDLLENDNYVLICGDLVGDEDLMYNSITQITSFKEHDTSKIEQLYSRFFGNIIIDESIKSTFETCMGIDSISAGLKPQYGGVILIDTGGTGKSLLKNALNNFATELGACVKERGEGDVTSYKNAGPQLVKRWYRGSKVKDHISSKVEEDLVKEAIKRRVPSFLIIDEAQRLIEKERPGSDNINAINSWKKYIQEMNKGGVTGLVVTLLIANSDKENIDKPLQQGGERLTLVKLGQPREKSIWIRLLNLYFKDNKINHSETKFEILSELLLFHLSVVTTEEFALSPREVEAICKKSIGGGVDQNKSFIERVKSLKSSENKTKEIDFKQVLNDVKKELVKFIQEPNALIPNNNYNDVIREYDRIISQIDDIYNDQTREIHSSTTSTDDIIKEWEEKKELLKRCVEIINKNTPPKSKPQMKANLKTNEIILKILHFLGKNMGEFSQIVTSERVDEKRNLLFQIYGTIYKQIYKGQPPSFEEARLVTETLNSIIDGNFFK